MFRKWFWVKALATLVVIGLLVAGGFTLSRVSWWQGYRMSQLAMGSEEDTAVPDLPFGYGFGHRRLHGRFPLFLFGVGLLFKVGLFLLLLAVIGKFFRFWAWKMAYGPASKRWPKHWHGHHGPMHPWCWGWEKPSDEQVAKVKPDAQADDAEA